MIRPAPLFAMALMLALPASLRAASFSVYDGRADREIGETTLLYIDERLVASFRLDSTHPQGSVRLTVAGGLLRSGHEWHRYALCGTVSVRNAQGATEIHEVDAAGLLRDADGHHFEALGAADFTLFYLADRDDPAAAQILPGRSGLCHAPIS